MKSFRSPVADASSAPAASPPTAAGAAVAAAAGAAIPVAPTPAEQSAWSALPTAVLLIGPGGGVSWANAQATALLSPLPTKAADWAGRIGPVAAAQLDAALAAAAPLDAEWTTVGEGARLHGVVGRPRNDGALLCVLQPLAATRASVALAQAQAERFQLLADHVPALIASFDVSSLRCLYANRPYAQAFGFDTASVLGLTVPEIVGQSAYDEIRPRIDDVLRAGEPVSYERQLGSADGGGRWLAVHLLPHREPNGVLASVFVLMSDITHHRRAEASMRESEERLGKFMEATAEGIVFHRDGLITDANPPLCDLIGYRLDELLGRRTLEFIAPDHVDQVAAVIRSGDETTYESVVLHRDGRRIPVEFIVRTMVRRGERLRMTIVRDIRDRQAAQARIHHLAHHDPLTGLPNRTAFIERLEQLGTSNRDADGAMALLFVDLDHFKRVNDSLGHLAGDRLLRTVAARITACLRTTDLVGRFGGDEFLVLLPVGNGGRAGVLEVANKLLSTIGAPVEVEGQRISVTPSIGIALSPEHGRSPNELIRHADAAMYRAKASGRAAVHFFEPQIAHEAYSSLVLEGELAEAIERGEFVLHFQPQVRAGDGQLAGAEALIRWRHPTRGLLRPDDFIALAEQRRLMLAIGLWVLSEAARCAQAWQAGPLAGVPVAVNLSSLQFQAPDFVAGVLQVLADTGLPGELLELELTERMLMSDVGATQATLEPLKAAGIRISVDDFGTGYSSLGHLRELPIDKLKIDYSFVQDLPRDNDAATIARAVIQMGRSLGMTVIAEGVERREQRDFLAAAGCDVLQGSLIGEAVDRETFERDWTDAVLRARLGDGGDGFNAA